MPNKGENIIVGSKPKVAPKATDGEMAPHEYWTPERLAAAKPVPVPKEGKEGKEELAAGKPEPVGAAGHVAPGHPKGEHKHAKPSGGADSGGVSVPNPRAYPYSTCGKLFFTQGGGDFSGSASVVAPNILLTAGHCVHNGGAWSTNVTFFPSYPLTGIHFSYSYEAAWTAWVNNGTVKYDYGMIWINNAPGNQLGWLGMLWNASTTGRIWEAIGYPGTPNPPFNGNTMDHTVGTFSPGGPYPGQIGLTNDNMEHGSSGGPWITDYNGSPREYANGLQSRHVKDGDFVEYGPYFDASVKGLYDWISNPANRH
jgi:V8-like Glu-specific endopeptidase